MADRRTIWCCGCEAEVRARLVRGEEIYPHRPALSRLPFWRCDGCGNYVGCHHKTKSPARPLGVIPTPEIRQARRRIHGILDPLWKSRRGIGRRDIYQKLADMMGVPEYHTANIRTVDEARKVYRAVQTLAKEPSEEEKP